MVTPAQELLKLVPNDQSLEVDAGLLNKDIGFVHTGQIAEIKIDSFPFTKYGVIDAEVTDISADAVEHEQLGLLFPLKASLATDEINVDGKWVQLKPGMSVTVEIKTGTMRLNDRLVGGDDDDILDGGTGNDTLRFGEGITADSISVSANDSDMLITLSDGQVISIDNWYSTNSSRIEQIEFTDGTTWSAADIQSNMAVTNNVEQLLDVNLNILIQSYLSFDEVSDDSEFGFEGRKLPIIMPFAENEL